MDFADSGRKTWTMVHGFDQISLRAHNYSLEGAMELNIAPFLLLLRCPFSIATLRFSESGQKPWFDGICFSSHNSSLEGATKLKFVMQKTS